MRVRDLGSLNGTWVNGRKIGQREKGRPPEACPLPAGEVELHDGDRLSVGDAEFVVGVETSPSDDGPDGPPEWHEERGPVAEDAAEERGRAACI